VEEGAAMRRDVGNKAEGARGAPVAGGGAVRVERRRESESKIGEARTEWGREWRVRWRCPRAEGAGRGVGERACRPRGVDGLTWSDTCGVAVSDRGEGEGRGRGRTRGRAGEGRAGFAGWAGWLAPARQ